MTHTIDKPLLYITLALLVGGLLILASASMVTAQNNFGTAFYYVLRQILLGGLIGIAALVFTSIVPYTVWRKVALPAMLVSFVLLALLFIPEISYSSGGARRWLQFGPVSFQPSEFLKFSFIIYLASWLDARREELKSISYGLIPFSLMLAIVGVFLIMQPDIGTLGVVVITAGFLYFIGGSRISQILGLGFLGIAAFYLVIRAAPYRLSRILVFLNPGLDPLGIGYQISQAFIAIGSGGFWGLGFGRSVQKYNYLPEPIGDSIFAIFAEETGLLGAALLIALFMFFLWRGLAIARGAPTVFGKLLAAGLSIGIMTQAFINMAAISGLLPLTGIPLPFVSYGGTSMMMTLASIGILLNISRYS
ncbi:MAG: cell division protein FtsW [Candidatus Sungbacteria bacterium RIFCSPHIGHO2_02_FULL_47_11]|uniref:Probable peptidoglycan glycosyltransferase FtsW n=1 Tax=Candidatus Sungbacteria bacterium RIFCSPHIGHO2_02_FULL_47_11 TaxID=1802270 RepID=A0A1G2KGG8_9BACT|nr:MAG: cell division protein FtsW [Candidatus Sungbacteria bacterium RIFCSPHIGHO2_02_FULL_47_11]